MTGEGVTIPADQLPLLPVIIHSAPRPFSVGNSPTAIFGEEIKLLGAGLLQAEAQAGDWLRFALVWQIDQPVETDLTVFTQLLGPDGQVWGQRDNRPGGGWYGLSLWPPGRPVVDDYAFQIQPDAPPGIYRLIVGLYHTDTLKRVSLQTNVDFVEAATIQVNQAGHAE
jgi:hypothetical protein